MNNTNKLRLSYLILAALYLPTNVWAETDAERLERLELELARQHAAIQAQQKKLEAQAHSLAVQDELIRHQSQLLDNQRSDLQRIHAQLLLKSELHDLRGAGRPATAAANAPTASARTQVSQAETTPADQPVGKAPPKQKSTVRPEVQSIANIGGVLTPKGHWIVEPSLQFSNSQVNKFSFIGVQILETFQIGILEAQDADRNLISPALTVRYGITPRLEIEGKLPYIWRDDTLKATIPSIASQPEVTRSLKNNGIGDAELALHYQMNGGRGGWPIFIGNVRYKSTTGKGPYDVARDSAGIETELPTGSGFQAVEPSVTALYPSDPAVFYANLGYLFNIKDNVNKTFPISGGSSQTVGEVDPGDAVRISFGMGYSINSKASFSLGYKHDFIQKTRAQINGVSLSTSSLDVGALLLGFSHQITPRVSANLNLELGVTADAPDVSVTLRLPYSF